jgi:hypothetical protein
MNEKQKQALIEQLTFDKNELEQKILIIEAKLSEQKEHLKTLKYVLENFED